MKEPLPGHVHAVGAAKGVALNVALLSGARVVVPRPFTMSVTPGDGILRLVDEARMDPACVASLRHAWASARELTGARDVACEVRFSGAGAIGGGSAGIILALHAACILRGETLPADVFATGAVGPGGQFLGGSAVAEKAAGLAAALRPLGLHSARLVCPLILAAPALDAVRILPVAGLKEACSLLGVGPGAPPVAASGQRVTNPQRAEPLRPMRYF